MAQKKKEYIIFTAIIILQIAFILFWAGRKTNYFIDEFMTMGYTRGLTGVEPTAQYIIYSPEWTFNEWHTNGEFKNQLLMTENTPLWKLPFFETVKLLVTGRNYFGLLNVVESMVGFRNVSYWPAVILNISFFAVACIFLISLMRKLSMSFFMQCMGLCLFGFSSYYISMAVYVRFYMLVAMLHILMLNLFYKLWEEARVPKIILYELGIFAIAYFSLKNTELTGPYFGCLSLIFLIGLLIARKWKQMISYSGFCLVGLGYIYFFTNYIQAILHPIGGNDLISAIVLGAKPENKDYIFLYDEWVMDLLSDQLFGHNRVFLMCAVALTLWALWKKCKPFGNGAISERLRVSPLSLAFLCGWFILLRIAENRNKGILLSKAGLYITIAWIIFEMLWGHVRIRKMNFSSTTGFVFILFISSLLYTCFTALPNLRIWRYSYFMVTTLIIVMWYGVDRIMKREFFKPAVKGWQIILIAFTVLGVVTPFTTKSVFYIYEEDKPFLETIRQHENTDIMLLCRPMDGQYAQPVYDCINIMPNDTSVYLLNMDDYSYDEIDYSDEFIVWDNMREDISDFLKEMEKRGYKVESLGQNHISQAYLCSLNS